MITLSRYDVTMKRRCIVFFYIFPVLIIANENWIKIESINKKQAQKSHKQLNVNLSQIEPIRKIIKRASIVKKLIDIEGKKERESKSRKSWFKINK